MVGFVSSPTMKAEECRVEPEVDQATGSSASYILVVFLVLSSAANKLLDSPACLTDSSPRDVGHSPSKVLISAI